MFSQWLLVCYLRNGQRFNSIFTHLLGSLPEVRAVVFEVKLLVSIRRKPLGTNQVSKELDYLDFVSRVTLQKVSGVSVLIS